MPKRSGKFYRKNEAEVMRSLGFDPTPNSGSGWIVKEDGQNEDAICQLKSTDATSIKISQKDIEVLEYNALVAHKIPVFAIQFLNNNEVFLLVRPEHLVDITKVVKGEKPKVDRESFLGLETRDSEVQGGTSETDRKPRKVIKSSKGSREAFMNEHDNKFKKKSKSAT